MKILIAAAVVLTAGLALPASAAADHGRTTAQTSMRYGPSTEYRRVAYIPRGGRVNVRRCTPRYAWCEVQYRRRSGWIDARYLVDGRHGRRYGSPGITLRLPLFDFFANIGNFDQDRGRRYRRHRHNDDYYHKLQRNRQRSHHGRKGHRTRGRITARTIMRYGPSREYRRVAYIPRGGRVHVRRCTPRYAWCEVQYRRRSGWINARYLVDGRYGRRYGSRGFQLTVPLFDFYASIGNFDQDRGLRYRHYRHNDDYYHKLQRNRQRSHQGRQGHRTDGRHEQRTDDENDDQKDDKKKRSGHKRPH